MKRLLLLSTLAAGIVALSGSSALAADVSLKCGPGNVYNPALPATLDIKVGDTVQVDPATCVGHPTVFDFPVVDVVAVTSKTFTTAGTFHYRCTAHSADFTTVGQMNGTVKVTAPVVTPPPTTTTTTTPPPTTTTTTTPPPPADTTAPTTTLSASATLKIGGLLAKGTTVTVKANEDATIAATLSVGNKVVASGNATATANADVKVALKVTKAGKAPLKKKRTVSATLKVVTKDKANNEKTDTKKIKLRK